VNAIVIEHVQVSELPEAWRTQLHAAGDVRVTVRIEEEPAADKRPAFGMWRDREETEDVPCYLRRLRAPRFPAG
jgi:hypothetical protein